MKHVFAIELEVDCANVEHRENVIAAALALATRVCSSFVEEEMHSRSVEIIEIAVEAKSADLAMVVAQSVPATVPAMTLRMENVRRIEVAQVQQMDAQPLVSHSNQVKGLVTHGQ